MVLVCAGSDLTPLAETLREDVLPVLIDWGRARHLELTLYVRWPDDTMTMLDRRLIHDPVARPTDILNRTSVDAQVFLFALIGHQTVPADEVHVLTASASRPAVDHRSRYLFLLAEPDAERSPSPRRWLFEHLRQRGRHVYTSRDLPSPSVLGYTLTRWLTEGLDAAVTPNAGGQSLPDPDPTLIVGTAPSAQTPTGWAPEGRTPVHVGTRPDGSSPLAETIIDENVQFTVYRPNSVQPDVWYPLLAFAHLAERRPDARSDQPDPLDHVKALAEQSLGEEALAWGTPRSDSRGGVPQGGLLTFVPYVEGVEFNPRSVSFEWREDVHQQNFRLRAAQETTGTVRRGQLTVYLGAFILADVDLAFRVDPAAPGPPVPMRQSQRLLASTATQTERAPGDETMGTVTAPPYRKIFPSYSHKDLDIVRQAEAYYRALGDLYMRDRVALRSGEQWSKRLLELIEEADVFQLFWSHNSMRSDYVRQEWEHAIALRRKEGFIRPTFWEVPMPQSDNPRLPPAELAKLHFHGFSEPVTVVLPPMAPTVSPVSAATPPRRSPTEAAPPASYGWPLEAAPPASYGWPLEAAPPASNGWPLEAPPRSGRSRFWLIGCAALVVVTIIVLIVVLVLRS